MSHLRVANDEEVVSSPIAAALHAATNQAINAGAVVVLLAYETPDHRLHVETVPKSTSITRGIVDQLAEAIFGGGN